MARDLTDMTHANSFKEGENKNVEVKVKLFQMPFSVFSGASCVSNLCFENCIFSVKE
jgi:hypothetical protein